MPRLIAASSCIAQPGGSLVRAVVQRVADASVTVIPASKHELAGQRELESGGSQVVGSISSGLLVYLGVGLSDSAATARSLAEKIANLRIFMDREGKMNLSALDLGLSALVVSQFTLYADARKGRRPSYSAAAPNDAAEPLYEEFCRQLAEQGLNVARGAFGQIMRVKYVNEGPITILLDTDKAF